MSHRPCIALLATGGTIAGTSDAGGQSYTAGVLTPDALLAQVPGIGDVADLHCEPCLALDSKDMNAEHWLHIAHATQDLLARSDIDGVVITHGTDTLEETALFLALTLQADKPVVITGAMRPSDAISADGPANLLDAVRVAADPLCRGHGVLVCMNEMLLAGNEARKYHAHRIDAFRATGGACGQTRPLVRFHHPAARRGVCMALPPLATTLPVVEIIHVGAGTTPELAELAVRHVQARGLVLALPGNGSVPAAWDETITRLTGNGIAVVRASRCAESFVAPSALDARLQTFPAGRLSASAARVALMLALATGRADADRFLRAAGIAGDD